MKRRWLWLTVPLAVAGCYSGIDPQADPDEPPVAGSETGQGGDDDDGGADDGSDDGEPSVETEPVFMRRLTRDEYNTTVRDLLGLQTNPASVFPSEERVHGFDNNGEALTFPPVLAEQAFAVAPGLADAALEDPTRFDSCAASPAADRDCAASFLRSFAGRAWRRPVTDEEMSRLLAAFDHGHTDVGFERGLHMAVQAVVIAAPFFYRMELGTGEPVPDKPGYTRPTHHEMASRLSYLFWGSLPDETLLEAAESQQLHDPVEIEAQARRMLDDPRAHESLGRFAAQWLELSGVAYIAKDPERFETWDTALPPRLHAQLVAFVDEVMFEGPWTDLLTADYTYVDAMLAEYLDQPLAPDDELEEGELIRVTLDDPARHAGILGHAGLMAMHAAFDQSSPTLRGIFVREQLLCGVLPEPPEDVDATPVPITEDQTTRQRYEVHVNDPSCAGCHSLVDPIGFGLETYDAAGLVRTEENGQPIDARGEVLDTDIGAFEGPVELGAALANSDEVRRCLATQWFRWAYGREPSDFTVAAVDDLVAALDQDPRMVELAVSLTQTDAFLYLPLP